MIKLEIALFLAALLGILVGVGVYLIWNRLLNLGLNSWRSKRTIFIFCGLITVFVLVTFLENSREPLVKQIRYQTARPKAQIEQEVTSPIVQRMRIEQDGASMGFFERPVYKRQLIFAGATLLLLLTLNAEVVKSRFGRLKAKPNGLNGNNLPANINQEQVLVDLQTALQEKGMYNDPELSLDRLAENLSISKYHLSQVINEGLQKNFYELVNGYRVDAALELLNDKDNDLSLLGIGYEVGFNSKASFYRAFKKQTGTTPAAYRKTVKQC